MVKGDYKNYALERLIKKYIGSVSGVLLNKWRRAKTDNYGLQLQIEERASAPQEETKYTLVKCLKDFYSTDQYKSKKYDDNSQLTNDIIIWAKKKHKKEIRFSYVITEISKKSYLRK